MASSNPYSGFKGSVTEYKRLHEWVSYHFGRPQMCEDCGTTEAKRYDWAAIDNRYTKLREDWKRLCRSCHQKFDADVFEGKRFTGKKHTEESKRKASEAMKKKWVENRELWKLRRNQWTGPATPKQ